MRAIDDGSEAQRAVLAKLREWGPLPESDVSRMLPDHHLVTDDFRDMEEQGLLEMAFIGDEYVLTPTTLGRLFLDEEP
jgi:hypothetical protein